MAGGSIYFKVFSCHFHDLESARLPACPYVGAPAFDRRVASGTGFGGEYVLNTNGAAKCGEGRPSPGIGPSCELHVGPLHLFAGEAFFEVQVEANEGEDDRDRLGGFVRVLRCVCVDNELMNEGGIGVRQGVESELVVEVVVAGHACSHFIERLQIGLSPKEGRSNSDNPGKAWGMRCWNHGKESNRNWHRGQAG